MVLENGSRFFSGQKSVGGIGSFLGKVCAHSCRPCAFRDVKATPFGWSYLHVASIIMAAEYDLTSKIGGYLDRHLVFPMLEFLTEKKVRSTVKS